MRIVLAVAFAFAFAFATARAAHAQPIDISGEYTGTWGAMSRSLAAVAPAAPPALDTIVPNVPTSYMPPSRRSWSFGMRFYWDVASHDGRTGVGLTNVELEIERRLGERWNVGVTAGIGEVMVVQSIDTSMRLRAAIGLRRDFDVSSAGSFTQRRTWIGVRGGVEMVDSGATSGPFGEVSLGVDWQLAGTMMGIYGAAGLTRVPSSATAMPPTVGAAAIVSAAPSGEPMSPYGAFGMRFAF
jgi:hypothetical protein